MKSLEMDALVFMQLVIIERFRNQKTRIQPYQNDIEHVTMQIRSDEWQCHISGLALRKRDRADQGAEEEMKKNDT